MSVQQRGTGRQRLPVPLILAAIVVLGWNARAGADPPGFDRHRTGAVIEEPVPDSSMIPRVRMGPIPEWTIGWHEAPQRTAIPAGTLVLFRQDAPPGSTIEWLGAEETIRDGGGSTAQCLMAPPGFYEVRVTVRPPSGIETVHVAQFDAVDFQANNLQVGAVELSVDPLGIDEGSSNEDTMRGFFGASIAKLTQLGPDHYRTSVDKRVHLVVSVDPPAFAPIIEWRVDGVAQFLGADVTSLLRYTGSHRIAVGPPGVERAATLEQYRVTITSHRSNVDRLPEGQEVTFEAETNPPGLEGEITWLSSTKNWTGRPILGTGPRFTVRFDNTWENGFQWLGVKADNDPFNQDQKEEIRCANCRRLVSTFNECLHFERDDPCRTDECIRNNMDTATCERLAPRGVNRCDTDTGRGPEVVQERRTQSCDSRVGWHRWVLQWHGCTDCVSVDHQVRCDTRDCSGRVTDTVNRGVKKKCGCP
jgi:hypothetical protein